MIESRLAWLFLDMNSYFASVEQELRPELRGRPTVVVPVLADSTCCIASSYEAKTYGIKTGTKVAAARKLCPDLRIVESRPEKYIEMHHEIVSAVNSILPVDTVHSIDEMSCRLTGSQTNFENAAAVAHELKRAIRERVGEHVRCSVGIATNRFLAKVASGMEKPDGFTVIKREDLPEILYSLSLTDLPGIGKRMHARLIKYGVHTVEELCLLSEERITDIWQSVVGKKWWLLLRGEDISDAETHRRTVGHSHVLPPQLRSDDGTRAVFIRLIHKAAFRLRRLGYIAERMTIRIDYLGVEESWKNSVRIGKRNDTQTMIVAFTSMWEKRPRRRKPLRVSVTFSELMSSNETSLSLLPDELKRDRVAAALDKINERYGSNSIYYGSMHGASESAPLRIAFTSIPDVIAEGAKVKADNEGPKK